MTSRPWPAMLPVRYVRIARPTDQLDEVVRFYQEGLGLPELDHFAGHADYRGVLLGLPGTQYHLEFTQHERGSPGPAPSRDNLLVLYFDDLTPMEQVATRLAALGHPPVEAENPYWTENGAVTVEDPDHWRIVLMPQPLAPRAEPPVTIEWHSGDRDALRPLFELAEDSLAQLDSYLHAGRILVARTWPEIVGHLQLTGTGQPGQAEVKNMAVREDRQGQGLGRRRRQDTERGPGSSGYPASCSSRRALCYAGHRSAAFLLDPGWQDVCSHLLPREGAHGTDYLASDFSVPQERLSQRRASRTGRPGRCAR